MPAFVRPSAISASTSRSRGESSSSALTGPRRADQRRDDLRVERRAAVGDAPGGVEEVVDVEHAVLEQVAEAAAGRHELDDVAGLDVLGEHEHAGAGCERRIFGRRARALVVVVGRHPHVDDREVRLVLADQREQRVGVARAADDLVAGVLEQPGEALAQEHGVLGDHDAHGSCTAIRVPAPGGLSMASVPPWAATRSACPAGPCRPPVARRRRRRRRSSSRSTPSSRAVSTATRVGDACLTALVSASQATKYAAASTSGGARSGVGVDLDRDGRAARQVGQRGGEPLVEPRRPDAGGDRAQVGDRGRDLVDGGVERGLEHPRLARQRALQPAQHDAERDEPLLRAVVQVALDPAALLVAGLGDPRARGLDLGELQPQLDAQPGELDRHRGRVEHGAQQVRAPSRGVQQHAEVARR